MTGVPDMAHFALTEKAAKRIMMIYLFSGGKE